MLGLPCVIVVLKAGIVLYTGVRSKQGYEHVGWSDDNNNNNKQWPGTLSYENSGQKRWDRKNHEHNKSRNFAHCAMPSSLFFLQNRL